MHYFITMSFLTLHYFKWFDNIDVIFNFALLQLKSNFKLLQPNIITYLNCNISYLKNHYLQNIYIEKYKHYKNNYYNLSLHLHFSIFHSWMWMAIIISIIHKLYLKHSTIK